MDILLFAALAFFIFMKLNKQLGNVDSEEKKRLEDAIAKRKAEIAAVQNKIIDQITQVSEAQTQADNKILDALDPSTKDKFSDILKRCNISAEFFVNGVKSAFEMIIKGFANADLDTLKFLLADNIYKSFEGAINARKSQEQTLTTNLIAIEKADIISANISGNFASIVVKIVSKQINYISDKSGQIVEGKKDEISELRDVWTFRKDVTSPNPNWVVVNTAN